MGGKGSTTLILVTGGYGLLGKYLKQLIPGAYPSSSALDITKNIYGYAPELVIHMAAYTDVDRAEIDKHNCFRTNVFGTYNMLNQFYNVPFVYISTEYARNPINVYGKSKRISEMLVENMADHYLIIRTLFKETPFRWDKACTDQFTQGDYVDVIASLIAEAITKWDRIESKMVYVGTGRKTMYELAQRTNPDVLPCLLKDIPGAPRPKDYL